MPAEKTQPACRLKKVSRHTGLNFPADMPAKKTQPACRPRNLSRRHAGRKKSAGIPAGIFRQFACQREILRGWVGRHIRPLETQATLSALVYINDTSINV